MKAIVLTVNFELFFGSDSGTVENTMIRPIKQLLHLLDKTAGCMTVFWDILHFWKLKQLEDEFAALKLDRELIEKQIKQLIEAGHDVQMLLYPHWIDAQWEGDCWSFSKNKLKLQQLSPENLKHEISTISGCVNISADLMENVIRQVWSGYRVTTIRAGGGRIEPFGAIKEVLEKRGVFIDCSVCPGVKNKLVDFSANYIDNPYRFSWSINDMDSSGEFTEVPISSVYFPLYKRLYNAWVNRVFYNEKGRFGDGTINGDALMNPDYRENFKTILSSKRELFTPEGCYSSKWNKMLNKVDEFSVTLISAKNLNPYTISMLESSIVSGAIRFISIDDRLSNY